MEISQDINNNGIQIQSYQKGAIKINGQEYKQPLAVTAEELHHPLSIDASQSITIDDLQSLEFKDYEVVLIGTGENLQFPSWDVIEEAQVLGTPLEVMATDAACRTFTILAAEGRKVLALLFP